MKNRTSILSPRRWLRWLAILGMIFTLSAWAGYGWLASTAQARVKERLAQRGLMLTSKSESWSLWGGVTLKDAVLSRMSAPQEPLISISSLHVGVLWQEAWQERIPVIRWQSSDATLTLHDEAGPVTLEHFTTDFVSRQGQIDLARLEMSNGPLTFALAGQVLTAVADTSPPKSQLNLRPLRAVLEALNFKPGTGPFTVTGNFALNLRDTPVTWSADLQGAGQQVEWRGLPMREASIQAQLSQKGLELFCALKLTKGSVQVELKREGWVQEPLKMHGTLTDSAARSDEIHGEHQGATNTLTLARLSGNADLVELARNIPALAEGIPAGIEVKTFPDIEARDFVWNAGQEPPDWSLGGLQLRTPAAIAVMVRDHPLTISQITGHLSREKAVWNFDELKGQLLDGHFDLEGSYDGGTLSKANVSLQSLRLASLSPWVGKVSSRLDDSNLSLAYEGTISNQPSNSSGRGSVVLTHAPVVQVPLLDQTYALFPKLLPDRKNDQTGECQLSFVMEKGRATISPFKATSESLTVTGSGTVDLVSRQVSGHARAKLRGLVGVVTAPLSHVLTDMDISGSLDNIRVSPSGPISAARSVTSGTVKTATQAAKGSVKLGGSVLQEGLSIPLEALRMFGRGK